MIQIDQHDIPAPQISCSSPPSAGTNSHHFKPSFTPRNIPTFPNKYRHLFFGRGKFPSKFTNSKILWHPTFDSPTANGLVGYFSMVQQRQPKRHPNRPEKLSFPPLGSLKGTSSNRALAAAMAAASNGGRKPLGMKLKMKRFYDSSLAQATASPSKFYCSSKLAPANTFPPNRTPNSRL